MPRGSCRDQRAELQHFTAVESVAIIHRLYELQRQARDADAWLWGLWLDPADYPVDIQPWILRRLDHAQKAIKAIGERRQIRSSGILGAL